MDKQPNFLEQFKKACFTFDKHCALQIRDNGSYRKFSYSDLWKYSRRISNYLIESGRGEAECITLLFENRPEWAGCFFGITSAACIAVPLDIKLKDKELTYIINDCKSRLLFVDKNNLEQANRLKKVCPDLQFIVCLDALAEPLQGVIDFSKVEALAEPLLPMQISDEDTALLVYTSGTTGYQKGVQITFSNLMFQMQSFQKILTPSPEDRFLSVLPLSHIFEITCGLFGPLFSGSSVTYLHSLKSKDIVGEIKGSKITLMIIVPLILRLFHNGISRNLEKSSSLVRLYFCLARYICLALGGLGTYLGKILFKKVHQQIGSSLRCFVTGAAPLDPVIGRDFELFGITVLEGYGLTETSPVISVNTLTEKKIGSVGKPIEGIEVRILKEDESAKEGEIITRGPHLMKGYFNAAEKTAEMIRDGWLHTGDIGYFDKQGFLYISGRLKNVIVTGKGKKVFPEELETELLRSPYIKDACVFSRLAKQGLRKGTEQVNAIIVPDMDYFLSHAKKATAEDIHWLIKQEINETSKNIADYKRIVDFKICQQDLPKTTTKKVKRREIDKIFDESTGAR